MNIRICEILKINNISQKQFAGKVGATESAVSHWISGKRVPSIKYILRICKEFSVSSDWLLNIK